MDNQLVKYLLTHFMFNLCVMSIYVFIWVWNVSFKCKEILMILIYNSKGEITPEMACEHSF